MLEKKKMRKCGRILHRLEILFWNVLIKIMSEAPEFSRFVIQARDLIGRGDFYRIANRAVIWSLLGLTLGFLLGVFSRLIS